MILGEVFPRCINHKPLVPMADLGWAAPIHIHPWDMAAIPASKSAKGSVERGAAAGAGDLGAPVAARGGEGHGRSLGPRCIFQRAGFPYKIPNYLILAFDLIVTLR